MYTNPICKGSFTLGTACGHCERCEEERNRQSKPAATGIRAVEAQQPCPLCGGIALLQWRSGSGIGGQAITNTVCATCEDCGSIFKAPACSTAGFGTRREAAAAFEGIVEMAKERWSRGGA